SLRPAAGYQTVRKTTVQRGVVNGITYYVSPKFNNRYGGDRNQMRQIEKMVTAEYKDVLRHDCNRARQRKQFAIDQAKRRRRTMSPESAEQMFREAEATPTTACDELINKFGAFSGYK
ncbi:unnamed protein product, partial [Discosporangium mesarthrocarpum]